jgi:hypothetical protein
MTNLSFLVPMNARAMLPRKVSADIGANKNMDAL